MAHSKRTESKIRDVALEKKPQRILVTQKGQKAKFVMWNLQKQPQHILAHSKSPESKIRDVALAKTAATYFGTLKKARKQNS